MSAVTMYGYLRSEYMIKAHQVAAATDAQLAKELTWTGREWRDDPDWPLVAVSTMTIQRVPPAEFATSQVALLRKQQTAVMATAQAAVTEIDRQINSLLAISMDGVTA